MSKLLKISLPIAICFSVLVNSAEIKSQNTDYEKGLNITTQLYLLKKEISSNILLGLVPKNDSELHKCK